MQEQARRRKDVDAFYGDNTITFDERLSFWKSSPDWNAFFEAFPATVLLPPSEQLDHLEQRYIHAERAIDCIVENAVDSTEEAA